MKFGLNFALISALIKTAEVWAKTVTLTPSQKYLHVLLVGPPGEGPTEAPIYPYIMGVQPASSLQPSSPIDALCIFQLPEGQLHTSFLLPSVCKNLLKKMDKNGLEKGSPAQILGPKIFCNSRAFEISIFWHLVQPHVGSRPSRGTSIGGLVSFFQPVTILVD